MCLPAALQRTRHMEDASTSESEEETHVPCPACGELLEAMWEVCPACLTQARSRASLDCNVCGAEGEAWVPEGFSVGPRGEVVPPPPGVLGSGWWCECAS